MVTVLCGPLWKRRSADEPVAQAGYTAGGIELDEQVMRLDDATQLAKLVAPAEH